MFNRRLISVLCALFIFTTTLHATCAPEVYFSPQDRVAEKLISLIDQETVGIKAAVYCLMSGEISQALQRAAKRGVSVEVIVDPYSVKSRAPIGRIEEKGVKVFVWDPDPGHFEKSHYYKKPLMHDKFCIFSDQIVWTGSFNFTREASRSNKENVVVLRDATVAALYLDEFQKIKKEGCRSYRQFLAAKEERKQVCRK